MDAVNKAVITPSKKELLLGLTQKQLKERYLSKSYYYFYKGSCEDAQEAMNDPAKLGQTWIPNILGLEYTPTTDVRNKVRSLMNKQKRFMFGVRPTLLLKPLDKKDAKLAEELRAFIDKIFDDTKFWKNTSKAFLSATIKKRVLLRIEANREKPIKLIYEPLENFKFETNPNDESVIDKVVLTGINVATKHMEEAEQEWYRYTYYMENGTCMLLTETFKAKDLNEPISKELFNTMLKRLPAWVILNGGDLGDTLGESDVAELVDMQNQYNRRISDYADALRFQMFGETYIIDGTEDTVNNAKIAPNALVPIVSLDEKSASVQKLQSPFSSVQPVLEYLKLAKADMYEAMSMPLPEDLKNIPSGKALKYAYTELRALCEEKWLDWGPVFEEVVQFIIEACINLDCYKDTWNKDWNNLEYTVAFGHNYPIMDDEDDRKTMALSEVNANVKSRVTYIKEFGTEEDAEGEFEQILEEITQIKEAEQDQFQASLATELTADNSQATTDTIDNTEVTPVEGDVTLEDNNQMMNNENLNNVANNMKNLANNNQNTQNNQ